MCVVLMLLLLYALIKLLSIDSQKTIKLYLVQYKY